MYLLDHNPYVGIQRTVFEQGWKRGRRELLKELRDDAKAAAQEADHQGNEAVYIDILLEMLGDERA